jgi:hypothetical protein
MVKPVPTRIPESPTELHGEDQQIIVRRYILTLQGTVEGKPMGDDGMEGLTDEDDFEETKGTMRFAFL